MKTPDKIYLQVCGECRGEDCKNCKFEDLEDNVTHCKERIYKKDIEYIRKDALLEWANRKIDSVNDSRKKYPQEEDYFDGILFGMDELIEYLNSM